MHQMSRPPFSVSSTKSQPASRKGRAIRISAVIWPQESSHPVALSPWLPHIFNRSLVSVSQKQSLTVGYCAGAVARDDVA